MKSFICSAVVLFAALTTFAQTPELRFIADTLVVQADGTYDADPDLATLTFQIFAQDRDLKRAYDTATRSIQHIVDLAQQNGLATFRRKNALSDIGRATLHATDVVLCGDLAGVHSRARGKWTVPA